MFSPCILPDEFYLGYFGRLNSFNGFNDHGERLLSMMREILPSTITPVNHKNLTGVLAYAADMTVSEFVRNHTLVPYRQMFTSLNARTILSTPVYLNRGPIRPQAYFCASCIDKDIHDIGFSYWRRTHQLPGMHVCLDHDEILRHIEKKFAFMQPPSAYIDTANTINDSWARKSNEHPAVRVFLELSVKLASSTESFRLANIKPLLAMQASGSGLVSSRHYIGNQIVNLVIETFPAQWLKDICRTISTKPVYDRIGHDVDMQFQSSDPYLTTQYLMEVAVLFDSANEAISAMRAADDTSSARKTLLRSPEIDFRTEFIRTRGQHRRIARENGRPFRNTSKRLRLIGLPNITGTGRGSNNEKLIQALRIFFEQGFTSAESARRAGVKLEDLEQILRFAGVRLQTALQAMEEVSDSADTPSLDMAA